MIMSTDTRSETGPGAESTSRRTSFSRSGAVAGTGATVAFALIHAILISDIWFMLPIMVPAGAACGLCIAWSYGLMIKTPSVGSWFAYNTVYVAMFFLLGAASMLAFDPVTTAAVLTEANEPVGDVIMSAMPMTVVFTLVAAVVVGLLFGRKRSHYLVALLACTVLVVFLGLNVSVIGLVAFPSGSVYLVAELLGLIAALGLAFAVMFAALEREPLADA